MPLLSGRCPGPQCQDAQHRKVLASHIVEISFELAASCYMKLPRRLVIGQPRLVVLLRVAWWKALQATKVRQNTDALICYGLFRPSLQFNLLQHPNHVIVWPAALARQGHCNHALLAFLLNTLSPASIRHSAPLFFNTSTS